LDLKKIEKKKIEVNELEGIPILDIAEYRFSGKYVVFLKPH